jgi:outer membrane protein TolC
MLGLALTAGPIGCKSPMERASEQQLRDQLLASNRAYLQAVAEGPVIETSRTTSEFESRIPQERREYLESRSGPDAYRNIKPDLGPDLLGKMDAESVQMTLQRAIQFAVEHNLEVQQARIVPGISEAQLVAAEAAFDPVFFANFDWQYLDTPRPQITPGLSAAFGSNQSETTKLETGIRKPLPSGAEIRAVTTFNRNYANPSFFGSPGNSQFTYDDANILLGITQPLLRNFGSDITRSNISLARNARGQSVQDLRKALLTAAADTEEAYWNLVFSRQRLLIQMRLLGLTVDDYEKLHAREQHDVSGVRLTEAASFVEIRRGEVIRARQEVRQASDALKRLINSPDLPLAGETMITPSDVPADLPIKYSLLDAVTTALRQRPELQRAILEIDDASIRMQVADNARLPVLNLSGAIRYNGVGNSIPHAYETVTDGNFIDYLVGAQFEMPLGNRAAEAGFTQRKLERQAITMNYQRAAQDVLLDVKNALRQLNTAYELIGTSRAARLSASDNLRAIEAQEEGAALTPEFLLDLKLTTQQRVADTETQEYKALTDYNTAVAKLYQAMGTLLQRNNINFTDNFAQPEKQSSGWKRLVR